MRVLSLFDFTGSMVKPWADAGHDTLIIDTQHPIPAPYFDRRSDGIMTAARDLSDNNNLQELAEWRPDIIFSFPPCTDLAVSGAAHFKRKRERDPLFQAKALRLAKAAPRIAALCKLQRGDVVPWFAENPISVLSTLWRKPDHIFNPCDYGGYIPEDQAAHPLYPQVIPDRDAYTKRTCLWTGNGFIMPTHRPVDPVQHNGTTPMHAKLGGKSLRTKNIRSATPRGFAQAVFLANRFPLKTLAAQHDIAAA